MTGAIQLLLMGGVLWAIIWVLYIMLQTILYGAISLACGYSGLYIASCVESATLFEFGNVAMTSSGIFAILLLVACLQYGGRFFMEFRIAYAKIINPFSRA